MNSYEELIGQTIDQAIKKLGYWWVLEFQQINCSTGFYIFTRSPCGHIELRTNGNVVEKVHYNGAAERYLNKQ